MYHPLITPMLALLILVFIVWCVMFYQRVTYILGNKLDVQVIPTRKSAQGFWPDKLCGSSDNLQNLAEIPPFFLVVCLIFILGDAQWNAVTPNWVVMTAYGFVAFRYLHSFIQCTYNNVNHRFACYLISCLCLWALLFSAVGTMI